MVRSERSIRAARLGALVAGLVSFAGCVDPAARNTPDGLLGADEAVLADRLGQPCRTARRSMDGRPSIEFGYYCVEGIPGLNVVLVDGKVVQAYETR